MLEKTKSTKRKLIDTKKKTQTEVCEEFKIPLRPTNWSINLIASANQSFIARVLNYFENVAVAFVSLKAGTHYKDQINCSAKKIPNEVGIKG
ncbi:hypothetical protein BpHYR1_015941 [Brachionus plicatilis]|uniref:Uncharacterized protein n=1 Tax=Brachionus plicatilis TaxID=10195 RepID=A0A3M7P1E5_BRAPC|nr:hypothetical protein BpHYR1_015941 [Brachionus plicatilis]